MSALFRIVYAAHANGTHHKLALDALRHMQRTDADAWQRVFLKHVDLYLEGSKAPDKSFKDFKNHVLHVGENYWGGAPEKVEAWYGHTVTALRAEKWADAAYAAGVLSHYYTDPIHPFHTGQTEAENAIHRACEWSISRSYNRLRTLGEANYPHLDVEVPDGDHWLRELTCDGAEYAHRYYEKLIAHYDVHVGTVRPEDGLDAIGSKVVAELLIYAANGFAHILDRAITDAGVTAPDVNLSLNTMIAALNVPAKWLEKRLSNKEDKAIVEAIYDELRATGRVEHALPEDDRVIRDLHAREVLTPKLAARAATRTERVPSGDPADVRRQEEIAQALKNPIMPAAFAGDSDTALTRAVEKSKPTVTRAAPQPPQIPTTVVASTPSSVTKPLAIPAEITEAPSLNRKSYLSPSDDLEAAPSIGPRMAQKFADLGILTVADFLGQNPHEMAEVLDDSRIDGETLTDWQDQAALVIAVPGLRGTHAQLLVGAGYRTAEAIADADPIDLSADVLTFAASSDGKRVLRDGNPPDIEKIKAWVSSAALALRAA